MKFIERLNELMKENGLTRGELCDKLQIGKNQIKYWEDKDILPNGETLIKMSELFDVSVDYILCREDSIEEKDEKEGLLLQIYKTSSDEGKRRILKTAFMVHRKELDEMMEESNKSFRNYNFVIYDVKKDSIKKQLLNIGQTDEE